MPGSFLLLVLLIGIGQPGLMAPVALPIDQAQPPIPERLKRLSAEVFSRGDRIQESIRELKEILALDPRSAEAHFLLGVAYRRLGSAEMLGEAKAELTQALDRDPDYLPARFYLAQIYLDLGRTERARDELQTGLQRVPGNPQFLSLLGETERQLGNPTRSLQLNRQALQADASFAQARYYLALALADLKHNDEAIRELEQVVQSAPGVTEPYLTLGSLYLDAAQPDKAMEVLLEGARVDPAQPDIRIQLARAYRTKGMLAQAEEQLKLALPATSANLNSPFSQRRQTEFDFYVEEGLVRLQQKRLAESAAAFQKAYAADPDHGPVNRYLAEVYLRQGRYPQALEYATRAARLGAPLPDDLRKQLQDRLREGAGKPK